MAKEKLNIEINEEQLKGVTPYVVIAAKKGTEPQDLSDLVYKEDEFLVEYGRRSGKTFDIVSELSKQINEKKVEIVKSRLIAKGFPHLVDELTMYKRFKNISIEIHPNGIEYYYANDGTGNGCFIVAIQIIQDNPDFGNLTNRYINTNFRVFDNEPYPALTM